MSELAQKIEEALESVRPYLKTDGGNVELVEISDDFIVKVRLLGACSTCTMSHMTMKAGIEDAIKKLVPSVKQIIAI